MWGEGRGRKVMWVGEWLAERECYECESGLVDNVEKICLGVGV